MINLPLRRVVLTVLLRLKVMGKVEENLLLQMVDSKAVVKGFKGMLRRSSFWDDFTATVLHLWMLPLVP